jgi:hypothetical protein
MKTVKIHYLGFGVQELPDNSTLEDAMFYLEAKYGAELYNKGVKEKCIIVDEESNTIVVKPTMNEMEENYYN